MSIGKGVVELRHDVFAVGHLLHVFGRDEADRVDVLEPASDEFAQIFALVPWG